MVIENGKVILSTKPCHCADNTAGVGKQWNITWCRNYTKARGHHDCTKKTCPRNPSGKSTIHEVSRKLVTCGSCNGTGILQENYCDSLTLPVDFPVKVVRLNRGNTFNENYLAIGCLYSATDYGRAAKMTDEEIINEIRNADYHTKNGCIETQAVKVVKSKEDLTLCDFIMVAVTRDGYSVRAGFLNVPQPENTSLRVSLNNAEIGAK